MKNICCTGTWVHRTITNIELKRHIYSGKYHARIKFIGTFWYVGWRQAPTCMQFRMYNMYMSMYTTWNVGFCFYSFVLYGVRRIIFNFFYGSHVTKFNSNFLMRQWSQLPEGSFLATSYGSPSTKDNNVLKYI